MATYQTPLASLLSEVEDDILRNDLYGIINLLHIDKLRLERELDEVESKNIKYRRTLEIYTDMNELSEYDSISNPAHKALEESE